MASAPNALSNRTEHQFIRILNARIRADIGRVAERNSLSATIENTDNDFMRLVVFVASLGLLGACTASDDAGYSIGNIRCDSDRSGEAVYDYAEDAVGYETTSEAIEAFRAEDSTWQLRDDWHALTLGDTSASPVEFTDDRGWVYLSVDLTQLNDSWVVSGYATCSPQGS